MEKNEESTHPDIPHSQLHWKRLYAETVYKTRMMTLLYKLEIYIYISCFESRNRGSFQTVESNWIPTPSFATRRINFSFFLFHRKMFRLVPDWQMRGGGKKHGTTIPFSREGKIDYRGIFFFFRPPNGPCVSRGMFLLSRSFFIRTDFDGLAVWFADNVRVRFFRGD